MRRIFRGSEFLRHAMTLMTGTSLSQILPIIASPFLTRLFTPADFGLLGLFTAITSVLAIPASGRFELAILLPAKDEDSFLVTVLSMLSSLLFSVLLLAIVFPLNRIITGLLHNNFISPWLYGVPVFLLLNGIYQSLNYWSNRRKQYKLMAFSRVLKSGLTIGVSLVFGIWKVLPDGLIIGLLIGQALATGIFLQQIGFRKQIAQYKISKNSILKMGKRYIDFPKFSVPADMINALSNQMPVFLMTAFFGSAVVGLLNLTQRVLGAPISVIASAFADVFKQKASSQFNKTGDCKELWKLTFKTLLMISLPVFAIIGLAAPQLIAFVFGEKWIGSGYFARLLAPYFFLAFIASPLSRTLYVAEKQKMDLVWQIGLFITTGAGLYMGCILKSPEWCLSLFATAYCLMYIVYLLMSYKYSCGKNA